MSNTIHCRRGILEVLHTFGPLTDERIWDMYESNRSAGKPYPKVTMAGLRSRRSELVDQGRVVATGDRERIRSGRTAIVWGVAPPVS